MEKEKQEFIDKVHPIFNLLKWRWCDKRVSRKDVEKLLNEHIDYIVTHKKITKISSGGLYAQKDTDGMISYGLDIRGGFIING